MDYHPSVHDNIGGGGYGYGGGGMGVWGLVIFFIILFAVFARGFNRDGEHLGFRGGHGDGFDGCGCGPKPWFIDRDVIEQGCKDRAAIDCDGDKTRALIVHESERAADREFILTQNKLMQKDNVIQTLMLEKDFNGKIAGLFGAMEKGFCHTDREIDKLSCELPKRPQVFARCDTTCLQQIPEHRFEPVREREFRERECFC